MRGNEVILVSMEEVPQLSRLGEQAGGYIADWLRGYGVELRLGEAIEEIEATPEGSVLRLASGTRLEAQMVILGTGVMPATGLAEAAHLPMESGRITVDDSMRTKVPGVWAVGDVAFALNRSAGRHLSVEHWGEALVQGEIAGRALAGEDVGWDSVPGFWSTIGEKTVKYRAWGDGFDDCRFQQTTGGFTVRYGRSGRLVGVLTHNCDDAYEESSPQIIDGEEL
jgi:NADPH-dependent 2,4-dienoyl-CoA reductase/sulfur reductase-like enzyme